MGKEFTINPKLEPLRSNGSSMLPCGLSGEH